MATLKNPSQGGLRLPLSLSSLSAFALHPSNLPASTIPRDDNQSLRQRQLVCP